MPWWFIVSKKYSKKLWQKCHHYVNFCLFSLIFSGKSHLSKILKVKKNGVKKLNSSSWIIKKNDGTTDPASPTRIPLLRHGSRFSDTDPASPTRIPLLRHGSRFSDTDLASPTRISLLRHGSRFSDTDLASPTRISLLRHGSRFSDTDLSGLVMFFYKNLTVLNIVYYVLWNRKQNIIWGYPWNMYGCRGRGLVKSMWVNAS